MGRKTAQHSLLITRHSLQPRLAQGGKSADGSLFILPHEATVTGDLRASVKRYGSFVIEGMIKYF
jgi:hypothetical protein